jgi:hypothetical protein
MWYRYGRVVSPNANFARLLPLLFHLISKPNASTLSVDSSITSTVQIGV